MKRNLYLDILRGVAVLLVIGNHISQEIWVAFPWARVWECGGWIGVDLFFVLSGYLVSGILMREFQRAGRLDLKRFCIRRGLRIYPPYYALLLLAGALALHTRQLDASKVLCDIFFVGNYFASQFSHLWSVALEEQFYLLLGISLWLMARRESQSPFSWIPRFVIAAWVVAPTLRLYNEATHPYTHLTHLTPFHLRLDALSAGVLLAYLTYFHRESFHAWVGRYRWILAGAGVLLIAPNFLLPQRSNHYIHTLGLTTNWVAFSALLSVVLHLPEPRKWMRYSAIAFIGRSSYSIYLWHVPMKWWGVPFVCNHFGCQPGDGVTFVVYVFGSLSLGIAASHLFEMPALYWRERRFPERTLHTQNQPALAA